MSIICSLESNSSIETSNVFAISLSDSIFGYPLPGSHFEIVTLETNSFSANCSCVKCEAFFNRCNFIENSISNIIPIFCKVHP